MNAMIAAIQKRKAQGTAVEGDHQGATHQGTAEDAQKDLHGLVASLSDHEKGQLKQILHADGGKNDMAIAKGGASSEEQGKIGESIDEENKENALEEHSEAHGGDGIDSDAIGKSMLDSRHMGGNAPTGKPRNLNDRMQQYTAGKLKAKGKL